MATREDHLLQTMEDGAGSPVHRLRSPAIMEACHAYQRVLRQVVGCQAVPRPGNSGGQGPSGNNEGWRQQFPQQSRGTMDSSSGVSRGSAGRGSVQDSPRTYSRPPLEMRQPIVTPRSPEGMGGSARGAAPSPSPSRGGGGYNNGGGGHAQPGGGGGGGNRGGGGGGSPHSGGSGHRR